ncbi:MAG TPA: IS1 family transposase [Gemmataceae bacterium]|nr:IS1 family transposase [Gemmataceae bacterium]
MQCPTCQAKARKFGHDRYGNQRYQCLGCRKTFSERPARPLGTMRLDLDKAVAVLQLLLEGVSVRVSRRISRVNRSTILDLLALVGDGCERMLDDRVSSVPVVDVQCDQTSGFVAMKEKTRERKRPAETAIGDAYCYVGMERESKLFLAWHLGRWCKEDIKEFADKLALATSGRFLVTTDGHRPCQTAIPASLTGVDFAQLVKVYATKDDHKYSPVDVVGTQKTPCCGRPDTDRICTSHVERQNLTIRMQNRRMTRLTNAFCKKWANHRAALALHFAYYNFCRVHSSLKRTPAMAAGLEAHPWTLRELVKRSALA